MIKIIFFVCVLFCSIKPLQSQDINQPGNSASYWQKQSLRSLCQNGYFFNSQTCQPCKQIDGGFCYCGGYNECETINCNPGLIEIEQQCVLFQDIYCLQAGFSSDGSAIVCFECKSNAQLIGGVCILKNQCLVLDQTSGVCTECATGYHLSNSQQTISNISTYYEQMNFCEPCDESCSNCITKHQCTLCKYGYFLDSSTSVCKSCQISMPHCSCCQFENRCDVCSDPFYLTILLSCVDCRITIPNCSHCGQYVHNDVECQKCQDGYYLNNNKCITCSNSIPNCLDCQDSQTCISCYNGFYLTQNTCQLCSSNIEGCFYCSDGQTCSTCQIGYYLNNNTCIKCNLSLNNCSICENNQICNVCQDGYYQENYTCSLCSNNISHCSICENKTKCNSCQLGYYLSNNQCQPCTDNQCQECQDSQSCQICNIGLKWDGSKCSDCSTQNCTSNCSNISYSTSKGCQQCSTYMNNCSGCTFQGNTLQCSSCSSGSLISTPNSEPCVVSQGQSCQQGQFPYGTNCPACSSAIPNCSVCGYNDKNYLECTQCVDGFQLGGQCEPCISTTQGSSSGSNNCNNCPTTKFYNSNNNSCEQCSSIQNCLSCSDSSTCTNCNPGYFINNNTCSLCSQIIQNCLTCNNNQTCKECDTGYYLNSNICYHCSVPLSNCMACINNQTCKTCASGYFLDGNACQQCNDQNCVNCSQNSSTCTLCNTGYYLQNQQCKPCSIIDNCISCENNSKCTACKAGNTLNQNNNQCQKCNDQNCINCNGNQQICQICQAGYYLDGSNKCQQCLNSCSTCSNSSSCTSCLEGYYLNGSKCQQCTQTLSNCTSCISNSICTICSVGSYLQNHKCNQCPTSLKYCQSCISDKICTSCQNGAYLSGQSCQKCSDKNCLICQSGTCTQCADDYQLQRGQCSYCKGHTSLCTSCSNGVCSQCTDGYAVLSDGTCLECPHCYWECSENTQQNSQFKTICAFCFDGYYPDTNGQCQSCNSNGNNVLRCYVNYNTSQLINSQCQDGYFAVNNQCIKAQNINTCSKVASTQDGSIPNSRNCLECWPNYIQSGQTCYICNNCQTNYCSLDQNGNSICSQCLPQFYADSNGKCQSCIKQCMICSGPSITECSQCQSGYFLGNNGCQACIIDKNGNTTCSICQDQQNCQTCLNGFYNQNGKCLSCQFGCNQCIAPGNICQSCIEGYFLQNGGCVLYQGNCLSISNGVTTKIAFNQNFGCEVCAYGFYLDKSVLIQNSNSLSIYSCHQCVNPDSAFVCRENPLINQPVILQNNAIVQTQFNLKGSLPLQPLGNPRISQVTCSPGFFWNSQCCMPCININNGICSTCSNFYSCDQIQCFNDFYLVLIEDEQQCEPIPNGCQKLVYQQTSKQIVCALCQQGYTLVGGVCLLYLGCQTINQNNGACTQCQKGYYLNWDYNLSIQLQTVPSDTFTYFENFNSFCSPCLIANCSICSSDYTCNHCQLGYFWLQSSINTIYSNPENENIFIPYQSNQTHQSSGQCIACPKYCANCLNQNSCYECFINFQISIDLNNPDCICPSPYQLDQVSGTCNQQSQNICTLKKCLQCSDDGLSCLTCATNLQYALTGTICSPCPKYCNICQALNGQTNTTSCIECQDGYYKIQTSVNSPINCQICTSTISGALRCQGTLENQTALTIIQCQDQYYLYNNNCNKAPKTNIICNTINSNNVQSCQTCVPGLIQVGSTCQQCQSLINNCITCVPNSSSNGYMCQTCFEGYVYNTQLNSCDQCPIGCSKCIVINSDEYQCQICYQGNYMDERGNCQGCPFNCLSCDSQYLCNSCQDGSYLGESYIQQSFSKIIFRACYPCQNACQTCNQPGKGCLTCPSQSFQYLDGCIQNQIPMANNIQYTLPCQQISKIGCYYCLSGFFLDKHGVCRQCIAPYQNFTCGPKAIPIYPNQLDQTTQPDPIFSVKIGENPIQPSLQAYFMTILIINSLLVF